MSRQKTLIDRLERRLADCAMALRVGSVIIGVGIVTLIQSGQVGVLNIQSIESETQKEKCASKQSAGRVHLQKVMSLFKSDFLNRSGVLVIGATNGIANTQTMNSSLCTLFQKEGEKQDTNFSKSRSFVQKESKQVSGLFGDERFSARKSLRKIRKQNGWKLLFSEERNSRGLIGKLLDSRMIIVLRRSQNDKAECSIAR